MKQTVVGVFDRHAAARLAAQQLRESGFGDSVYVTDEVQGATGTTTRADAGDDGGVLAHVRHFFADLFGRDDSKDVGPYADAVRRGGALVKVEVDADEQAAAARSALKAAGAVEVEPSGDERHLTGFEEGTSLTPAASGAADLLDTPAGISDDADSDLGRWRAHYTANFAAAGDRWEDYEPAYRWGDTMRDDPRYRGRAWDEVEPELRSDWEGRQAGTWERFKAAVRHAWDRMTP